MKRALLLLLLVSAGQTGWSATKDFNPADCPPNCCYGKAGSETLESHCKTTTRTCTNICYLTESCAVIGNPNEFTNYQYPCRTLSAQITGCWYIGTNADQFPGSSCDWVDVECSCNQAGLNPCMMFPCLGAQHEDGCFTVLTECFAGGSSHPGGRMPR